MTTTRRLSLLLLAFACVLSFGFASRVSADGCTYTLPSKTITQSESPSPAPDHFLLVAPNYLIYSTISDGNDIKSQFNCLPQNFTLKLTKDTNPDVVTAPTIEFPYWSGGTAYATDDVVWRDGNVYESCVNQLNTESNDPAGLTNTTCETGDKWWLLAPNAVVFKFTITAQNDYILEDGDVVTSVFNYTPAPPELGDPGITTRDKQIISLALASWIGWLTIKQFRFRTHD